MNNPQAVKNAQIALSECTGESLEELKSFIRSRHPQEKDRRDSIRLSSTNEAIAHVETLREDGSFFGMEGIDGLGASYRLLEVKTINGVHIEKEDLGSFSREELEAAVEIITKPKKTKAKKKVGPEPSLN